MKAGVCGAVVIRLPKSTTPKRIADITQPFGTGHVIYPSQAVRIVSATKSVDFRKGHDGPAAPAERELDLGPHSGIIVMFRANRGDRIKVL